MKPLILLVAMTAGAMCGLSLAVAEPPSSADASAAAQALGSVNGICPVEGHLVTAQGGIVVYAEERIAFRTPGAGDAFRQDPVRYIDRMRLQPGKYAYISRWPTLAVMRTAKAATGASNGRCPVMGRPVTAKGGSARLGDQTIAFCCPPCRQRFEADPERYMRRLRADPLAYLYDRPGPTHTELRSAREAAASANGLCPVMRRLVTVKGGSVEFEDQRIAFCCPGCAARFTEDAATYMATLRAEPAVYGYMPSQP
jgi:YHS domain-containing protein